MTKCCRQRAWNVNHAPKIIVTHNNMTIYKVLVHTTTRFVNLYTSIAGKGKANTNFQICDIYICNHYLTFMNLIYMIKLHEHV